MTSTGDDTRVFAELWTSFDSLVRSYVAAFEIGRKEHAAIESSGTHLTVQTVTSLLDVRYDPQTGSGSWRTTPGAGEGSFRIYTDSTVGCSDRQGRLDLEVAAEAFTAKILDEDRAA